LFRKLRLENMMERLLLLLVSGLVPGGGVPTAESAEFSREAQVAVITATVRVRNAAGNQEGSGILVGRKDAFVYVLTAHHLTEGAKRLEIDVFSKTSYPEPDNTYAAAEVAAVWAGSADLALLRFRTTDPMPGILRLPGERETLPTTTGAVLAVGCEGGKAPKASVQKSVTRKIARRPEEKDSTTFWEMQANRTPGASGGPLVDRRGLLVGVCSGSNRDQTYFTHIEEIHRFLKRNGYRWLVEERPVP
jgi:S1-C subfamily serine protease